MSDRINPMAAVADLLGTFLPLRCPLWPGESLRSFKLRLAWRNQYRTTHTLEEAIATSVDLYRYDHSDHPASHETYEALARYALIRAGDLYEATAHPYATLLTPPGEEIPTLAADWLPFPMITTRVFARHLRARESPQYCPACLAEQPYHRRRWYPLAVAACLRHHCLLRTHCPHCDKAVDVAAIVRDRCRHCDLKLSNIATPDLNDDSWGLRVQQMLLAWLGEEPLPEGLGLPPEVPDRVLYRVLYGLGHVVRVRWEHAWEAGDIRSVDTLWLGADKMDPRESYYVYATAARALTNWPQGLYAFLDDCRGARTELTTLSGDFGTLYTQWLSRGWNDPVYNFIQDAFDEYLLMRGYDQTLSLSMSSRLEQRPTLRSRIRYLSVNDAARWLAISPREVRRLAHEGKLEELELWRGQRAFTMVKRADVEALQETWNHSLPLEEAAQFLGLNRKMLLSLIQSQLLDATSIARTDAGRSWLIHRDALAAFRAQIESHARWLDQANAEPGPLIPLAKVLKISTFASLRASDVIRRICDGSLPPYLPKKPEYRLDELQVEKAALERLRQELQYSTDWLPARETARMLQVKSAVLDRWTAEGLLGEVRYLGKIRLYRRSKVREFHASYLRSDEVARLLQITKGQLAKWEASGRLKPISGGNGEGMTRLWRHADVVPLIPGNHYTTTELVELLDLTRGSINRWIKQGILSPISGPGIDGHGTYLFPRYSPEEIQRLRRLHRR
jgi:hypothetical protein